MKNRHLLLMALTMSKEKPLVGLFRHSDKEAVNKLIGEYMETLMAIHIHLDQLDQKEGVVLQLRKD